MERAIAAWSADLQSLLPESEVFLRKIQKSYTVYGDLVLLPSTAFPDDVDLSGNHELCGITYEQLRSLYETIAIHLKATHVATTRPIPLTSDRDGIKQENIIRAPLHFPPLYGDFGPTSCSSPPSHADFEAAYWVTAKQNGIYQCWAPRWSMFSRGNISEKARLLSLPSVSSAVGDGKVDGEGCAAVDLYAGIGYFAFSYLKAGISKVLCWDLNPWSTEGLMRGARKNKWDVMLVDGSSTIDWAQGEQLLVFNEDNAKAADKIQQMRDDLPPIRHVNCGLLPTSEGSWRTAVEVLDDRYDGWLHVHENFAIAEIEQKARNVRAAIERLVHTSAIRKRRPFRARQVKVDYINRLKSYAPGVIHCVLDIHIAKYEPN